MMTKKNIEKLLRIFLLAALTGLAACSGTQEETAASPEVVRNVPVISAIRGTVPDYLEAVGTVRAVQSSEIAGQMTGNVLEIAVHEGDRVHRGQVLAVLDDAQPRAAFDRARAAQNAAQQEVVSAEADLRLAQATFQRYQDLYNKKSVSPQEFDEVKARFQGAQARRDMSHAAEAQAAAAVMQAQTAQSYSRIRAPFDGVVTAKKVDVGALASPGMPLLTAEDPRHYRLEATVDESDLKLIRLGQTVSVHLDAPEKDLTGKVSQIVPAADSATHSFLVKIALPADPLLHSGVFGRVRVAQGEKAAVLVPRLAVMDRGQLQAVYTVDSSQVASLHYVTLGDPEGDKVEVLSGLDGTEKLVADPAGRELAGKKIEAAQ